MSVYIPRKIDVAMERRQTAPPREDKQKKESQESQESECEKPYRRNKGNRFQYVPDAAFHERDVERGVPDDDASTKRRRQWFRELCPCCSHSPTPSPEDSEQELSVVRPQTMTSGAERLEAKERAESAGTGSVKAESVGTGSPISIGGIIAVYSAYRENKTISQDAPHWCLASATATICSICFTDRCRSMVPCCRKALCGRCINVWLAHCVEQRVAPCCMYCTAPWGVA